MQILISLLTILFWAIGFLLLGVLVVDLALIYMNKKAGPLGGMLGSAAIAGWVIFLSLADILFSMFNSTATLSPFGSSTTIDVFLVLACAAVLFLAWEVHREMK